MTLIRQDDFIQSITDSLQFISYYHPIDFIQALDAAYHREKSPAAKEAMAQILVNSRMCALGHRPICQDTGIVVAFIDIGMEIRWNTHRSLEDMVNEGVRLAYTQADNPLRASLVSDPAGTRKNTKDNTPAVVHVRLVTGNKIDVHIAAKGGGSENKARLAMLNPTDDIAEWVERTVPQMGAGWCPPGVLGIGIGGTAEKATLLAKRSLMSPIDIQALITRGATSTLEKLRLDIFQRVNALGIGAQGLGGLTTVLDVKILDFPTHAASKPVAIIPNCAATRHIHFSLDGTGPAPLVPPALSDWPKITLQIDGHTQRIDLETLTAKDITHWQPGDRLLLSGRLLTGRDAAHKRLVDLLNNNQPLPQGLNFNNRFIYYVGPVDPTGDEIIGPAGPTTATRMDKFTYPMLAKTGLLGMIGKAERGPDAINAIKTHQAVYLVATGGAAYLVSKAIRASKVIAFEELGMEAIHEFIVEDMPVTVAVNTQGKSIHQIGPAQWQSKR